MSDELTKKLADNGRLDQLIVLVQGIDTRLQSLEAKVDERLHDTRPIWEGVQARLDTIETNLTNLRADMDKGFRNVGHRLNVISVDINQIRADIHNHEVRLDKLEGNPS